MDEKEQGIDIQKIWEELEISNDFLFGKVMQDAELCKGLLERIFPGMKIGHIEYPTLQKIINPDFDAKSVRLDVYVVDGMGTVYDIEMQMTDTKELAKRTRYYQAMMDLEMIDKGELYKKLKKSFVIFICPFDLFGEGRHIYTFRNFCEENKRILLGGRYGEDFPKYRERNGGYQQGTAGVFGLCRGKENGRFFCAEIGGCSKKGKAEQRMEA